MTTFKDAQRSRSKPVARSKRTPKVLTEDQEQIMLMSWAHHVKFGSSRLSDYLIHIPNGGSRNIIEAANEVLQAASEYLKHDVPFTVRLTWAIRNKYTKIKHFLKARLQHFRGVTNDI